MGKMEYPHMMTRYPWEEQTLYEPPPIRRAPRRLAGLIFASLCIAAMLFGAMWALRS